MKELIIIVMAIWLLVIETPLDAQTARSTIKVSVVELGFGVSHPSAVNNAGYVAGQADDDLLATLRTPSGDIIKIDVRGDVLSMTNSTLLAVTGQLPNGDGFSQHCGLWSERGEIQDLTPTLVSPELCLGHAINARGDVAGVLQSDEEQWAYLLTSGDAVNLGVLPGDNDSEAFDLNESRTVVGVSVSRSGSGLIRAFVWRPGQGMVALPFPSDQWKHSIAKAINSRGDTAGTLFERPDTSTRVTLAVWKTSGQLVTLDIPDAISAVVNDINEKGWVVGTVTRLDQTDSPFLWLPNDDYVDLGQVLGVPGRADAINDRGMIVGQSDGYDGVMWVVER